MTCPAPCRQHIHGANKVKVNGVWKHKRCPRTVWQKEEIERARKEARRLAKKIGWTRPLEEEPKRPSEWRTILKDVMTRALNVLPKRKKKK